MGKRELILIVVFAVVGVGVYQATAPPAGPGERDFSLSGFINDIRREFRSRSAAAEVQTTDTAPVPAGVTELRVALESGEIRIEGEERADLEYTLSVRSQAHDDAEAQATAKATVVKLENSGSILFARVTFPREGTQRASLVLKVPARLRVRIEGNRGPLAVTNVAAVELGLARGDTTVKQIAGRATISQRGGDLAVADVGALKVTARGSNVQVDGVRGELVANAQGGELKGKALTGPVEIDGSGVDVTLDGLEKMDGLLRITAAGGSIAVNGLRSESRIDARGAEVDLSIASPALIAVFAEGGEPVEVTLPAKGFTLDAVNRNGEITATPDGQLQQWGLRLATEEGTSERRVTGEVDGGGPLITVRSQQGTITLRAPAAAVAPGS